MKLKRAFAALLVAALLGGCAAIPMEEKQEDMQEADKTIPNSCSLIPSTQADKPGADNTDPVRIVYVNAKELISPNSDLQDNTSSAVAKGANDFAFRLSAALAKEAGNENLVCSPYSVWMPLAALVNATDDEHKVEFLAALGASGIGEDELNIAASRMLFDLTKQGSKNDAEEYDNPDFYMDPLKIANAIFVGHDVTLKANFAQTFMDYFRGNAMNVDFSSPSAVDAVNKWASDNTEGLIDNIINEFDRDTIAAIANAIYFSDRWTQEFDPDMTKEGVFHAPDADRTAHFMLKEGDSQTYYEDDDIQTTSLSFKTGGGMYILLPKDGDANGLLSSMTAEYFDKIKENARPTTGKLLLPRFSIKGEAMDIKDTLIQMGIPIFNEHEAPLTGGLIEEDIDVWASSAVHKALIEVDEKGTTAAAVTVVAMSRTSLPLPTEPFEMVCDRPFAFILYGYTSDGGNQVLFTGVVNQP